MLCKTYTKNNYLETPLSMKNFNTILILLWILSSCVLIIENIVFRQPAFVYVYQSTAAVLCVVCIITGFMLGYGIKWKMTEWDKTEEDTFDF